jgi:CheY-like chemotaxis protein
MKLTSLVVCSEPESSKVLSGVLEELSIRVEICADPVRSGVRLAQEHFDLLVIDCARQSDVKSLLRETNSQRGSGATLAVVVAGAQEKIREMFTLGVNFVLYKPLSHERAMSTLLAAQTVLYKDKRRKNRVTVHAHATVDYAGGEQSKATLVDLAADGMAVNFGKHLPPTSKVYFQFQLPGLTKTIRLSGVVVWQDWSGRAGVQFLDVLQSSRRLLDEWLQKNINSVSASKPNSSGTSGLYAPNAEEKITLSNWSGEKPQANSDKDAVARLRSERENRRGETRYACRLGAEVYERGSSVRNYCHLSDLSPGGCYLEMAIVFPLGTEIEITVRTHDMKLRVSGEVKASHPSYGMGILFKLNTKEERSGVQQLIDFVAAAAESN